MMLFYHIGFSIQILCKEQQCSNSIMEAFYLSLLKVVIKRPSYNNMIVVQLYQFFPINH